MIIRDSMKRNVISIPSTATIRAAAQLVVDHHIGLLPVVDEQGKLMGVVEFRRRAKIMIAQIAASIIFWPIFG